MVYPWAVMVGIGVGLAGLLFMMFQENQNRQRANENSYGHSRPTSRNGWDFQDYVATQPSHRKRRLSKPSDGGDMKSCTICQEHIVNERNATVLPCLDKFHTVCIQPWLRDHASCPNCREEVIFQ